MQARSGPRPRVFISYRWEDTGETASRLARDIERSFGREAVFLDQERLEGGDDWPRRLRDEVSRASVVFVLVGARWLTITDAATGAPRLENPEDWVRQEIEVALQAGSVVVPVLVAGAPPLTRSAMEHVPSLARLADLQASKLRREEWDGDLHRLQALLQARGFRAAEEGGGLVGLLSPRRLVIGGAAIVVVGGAVWMMMRPPPLTPAPPTPAPPTAATSSPSKGVVRTKSLDGTVTVRSLFAQDFAARRERFTIEARDPAGGQGLAESGIDADGSFRLAVRIEDEGLLPVELTWKWTAPDVFVLWPVVHPPAEPPFQGYKFSRINDLWVQEKLAAVADVRAGNFADADQRLRRLLALLDQYGDWGQPVMPGWTRAALTYKLLQEVCAAAAEYRGAIGRSKVGDARIAVERQWRRLQFTAAQSGSEPEVELARALNSWARFSREVYSKGQQSWPDRPVLSNPGILLESADYATWLREDLLAVADQLQWLRANRPAVPALRRLTVMQKKVFSDMADGHSEVVPMSALADLLNALVG